MVHVPIENPSPYQEAIFTYIRDEKGHLVVKAVAGGAKTTTAVESLNYIPRGKSTLFLAYNKTIAETLVKRVPPHVKARTFHSFGFSVLKTLRPKATMDADKVYNAIRRLSKDSRWHIPEDERVAFFGRIERLVNLMRLTLKTKYQDVDLLCEKFDIDNDDRESEYAVEVFGDIDRDFSTFDFTDMVYVPAVYDFKTKGFDLVYVDEFQDCCEAQFRLAKKVLAPRGRLVVIGDPNQCFPAGTLVDCPDGQMRIEEMVVGDLVLSGRGNRAISPFKVSQVLTKPYDGELVRVTLASGRTFDSTPDHMHFGGYNAAHKQATIHFVYLMYKESHGYRIGTTFKGERDYDRSHSGYDQRLAQEGASRLWIISTHTSDQEARQSEIILSLMYQIPTVVFKSRDIAVQDQSFIDGIFKTLDTRNAAKRLMTDFDLDIHHPHYVSKSVGDGRIPNVTIRFCDGLNTFRPMHSIQFAVKGGSREYEALVKAGWNLTGNGKERGDYRFRSQSPSFQEISNQVDKLKSIMDFNLLTKACFGLKNLPFTPARHLRVGMQMFGITKDDGVCLDTITAIDRIQYSGLVYDLNVEKAHNYIVDGILTHNCIYAYQGAEPRLFDEVESLPNTITLPLSVSYRCSVSVVEHAQEIVQEIEPAADAPKGEVIQEGSIKNVKEGDFILCRLNVPLVALALEFLRQGRKAVINGSDIGKSLRAFVEPYETLSVNELERKMWAKLTRLGNKLREKFPDRPLDDIGEYQRLQNKIQTVQVLSDDSRTAHEVMVKIQQLFSDDLKRGIILSTVHKAKGLEAENVFILEPQLIPFPRNMAVDWQRQQEYNIDYVARTRAITKLEYIRDWSFFEDSAQNA